MWDRNEGIFLLLPIELTHYRYHRNWDCRGIVRLSYNLFESHILISQGFEKFLAINLPLTIGVLMIGL